jgi:hypothetical protein
LKQISGAVETLVSGDSEASRSWAGQTASMTRAGFACHYSQISLWSGAKYRHDSAGRSGPKRYCALMNLTSLENQVFVKICMQVIAHKPMWSTRILLHKDICLAHDQAKKYSRYSKIREVDEASIEG